MNCETIYKAYLRMKVSVPKVKLIKGDHIVRKVFLTVTPNLIPN